MIGPCFVILDVTPNEESVTVYGGDADIARMVEEYGVDLAEAREMGRGQSECTVCEDGAFVLVCVVPYDHARPFVDEATPEAAAILVALPAEWEIKS